MNSQHNEVRQWLESLFMDEKTGKAEIPNYEVNEETLNALSALCHASVSSCRDVSQLHSLQKRQSVEYKAETERIQQKLNKLGVAQQQLSGPVEAFVSVLGDVSSLLEIDHPTENDLSLALNEIQERSSRIPTEALKRERKETEDKENRVATLKQISQNQAFLKNVQKEAARNHEHMSQSEKKLAFMKEKQKEYARTIDKYEALLNKTGANSKEISHESIVQTKRDLEAMEETLAPLKAKLEGYQELPANLDLAKVKVAEAQKELEELSHQLTKEISMLHI